MRGVNGKMSLKPGPIRPVPKETNCVAGAAFPKGNLYLTLRDKLGPIFDDEDFVGFVSQGRATRAAALATGPGDHPAVSGEPF